MPHALHCIVSEFWSIESVFDFKHIASIDSIAGKKIELEK